MKRIIKAILSAIIITLFLSTAVLAVDSWGYYLDITITDTSGTARTYVPVLTGVSGSNLNTLGYIDADGLDTRVRESDGTTDLQYMVGTAQLPVVLTSLGINQSRTIRLYMNYSPSQSALPIVTGLGGYVTTADAPALEPGNNFEIEIKGWIDTSSGSNKDLLLKTDALRWYVSNTSELTATLTDFASKTIVGTGITTGFHTLKIVADGTDFKMYDGAVEKATIALAGSSTDDTINNWVWCQNNVSPYQEYIKLTVGGTLLVHYQPNTIVSSTTLPDREGAAQNGTITWGTNTSMTVTIGAITSYADTIPDVPGATAPPAFVNPITQPSGWYAAGTGSNLPFYDTFNSAATSIGMTTQTLYLWVILALAAAIGIAVMVFTGSPLLTAIGCGMIVAAGVSSTILSTWMLFTYIILAVGVLYLARQV